MSHALLVGGGPDRLCRKIGVAARFEQIAAFVRRVSSVKSVVTEVKAVFEQSPGGTNAVDRRRGRGGSFWIDSRIR